MCPRHRGVRGGKEYSGHKPAFEVNVTHEFSVAAFLGTALLPLIEDCSVLMKAAGNCHGIVGKLSLFVKAGRSCSIAQLVTRDLIDLPDATLRCRRTIGERRP